MTVFKDAYININGDSIYIVTLDVNGVEYEYYWNFGAKGRVPSHDIYHSPFNFQKPCPFCGLDVKNETRCPQSLDIYDRKVNDVRMDSIFVKEETQPIGY